MSKLRSDELVNMEGDGSPNFPQGATSIEPTADNQVATKSYVDSTISAGLGNVVSSTAPTNPVFGSFWTDTSVAPRVLKTWDGTAWVEFDGTTAGISGLIRPPVEVLTPLNGSGITEFTQYEPLSSTITAVGEAGTIAKNTDNIQSVTDESAWNQSQVWSTTNLNTNSNVYLPTYPVTRVFDGNIDQTGGVYAGNLFSTMPGYMQFDFTEFPSATSVEVILSTYGSGWSLEINGSPVSGVATQNIPNHSVTVPVSGFTSIKWTSVNPNNFIAVAGIKVDGKLLVDEGVAGAPPSGNKVLSFPTNTNFGGLSVGQLLQAEYATLDPTKSGNFTLSNGNLDYQSNSQYTSAFSDLGMTSGKWYFEAHLTQFVADAVIGISYDIQTDAYIGSTTASYGYEAAIGAKVDGTNGFQSTGYEYYTNGDIISCAFDADNGKVYFAKNGVWLESGNPENGTNPAFSNLAGPTYYFGVTGGNGGTWTVNFGASPFTYSLPSGYLGLGEHVSITAIDSAATPPTVTVDGGDWDTSNQSQVWSTTNLNPNSNVSSSYPVTRVFDGNINQGEPGASVYNGVCFPSAPGYIQLDFTEFSTATSVEVFLSTYGSGWSLEINGSPVSGVATQNIPNHSVTVPVSGFTSIKWTTVNGNNFIAVAGIKVDGKLLIDAGVSGLGDRYLSSSISYEKSLTFSDTTELANMVTPLEMVDANGDVVTPVSDTIANVNNNVLTLQGDTNLEYFQPGDEVQTGVQVVSVDQNAPSITVDGGEWLGADGTNSANRISRSLRFNSADSAYLSRTPSSSGNTSTFTISSWVKRTDLGGYPRIFGTYTGGSYIGWDLEFNNYHQLDVHYYDGSSYNIRRTTTAVYRDISAWYHVVLAVDLTISGDSSVRLYVNGTEVTEFSTKTNASAGYTTNINTAVQHRIGYNYSYSDFYLADYHFVDGQALAPTEFGEFDSNGVWQAKEVSISSPYNGIKWSDYVTISEGNTGSNYDPDSTLMFDGSTSSFTTLFSGDMVAPYSPTTVVLTPPSPITVSTGIRVYMAVNRQQKILVNGVQTNASVSAGWNDTGFTGTLTSLTIGPTQLGSSSNIAAIEIDGVILIDNSTDYGTNGFHLDFSDNSSDAALGYDAAGSNNWTVNNLSVSSGAGNDSLVDTPTNYGDDTGAGGEVRGNYPTWNPLAVTPSYQASSLTNGNLDAYVTGDARNAYSTIAFPSSGKYFFEVSLDGSFSGAPIVGVSIFTGTSNAYPSSVTTPSAVYNWNGTKTINGSTTSYGATFGAGSVIGVAVDIDSSTVTFYKNGASQGAISLNVTGAMPHVGTAGATGTYSLNAGQRPFAYAAPSGYKALCDTNLPSATIKDGSKHFDVVTYTGNGSTQTISGLEFSPDLVWLKSRSSGLNHRLVDSVQGVTSTMSSNLTYGKHDSSSEFTALTNDGFSVTQGNSFVLNNSSTDYVAWCWNAGDTTETIAAGDLNSSVYDQSQTWSNWSAETGSLYLDGRRVSAFNNDFTNIGPGSQLHVIQWNGSISWSDKIEIMVANQASISQSGQKGPWFFEFTHAGGTLTINSSNWTGHNSTDAEISAGTIPFFDFTSQLVSPLTRIRIHGGAGSQQAIGIGGIKTDDKLLVDSGVSVAAVPEIGSQVRANPEAGFSIVKYTGNSSQATVAHGLGKAPELVITKAITGSSRWAVQMPTIIGGNYYLELNSSNGKQSWGSQTLNYPTSTTFDTVYANGVNESGVEYVGYCFAPVEGYSAIGSWTGNGSADGPFVYTGMRPKWIMWRSSSNGGEHWHILDAERDPHNLTSETLYANLTNAESTFDAAGIDILSNGFKVRGTNPGVNGNNYTYIFLAFAENPAAQDVQTVTTGDTQVALDALAAIATEIVETDGTTMYLNSATGPWRTGLSIEGSQINAAPPGPSEVTFTTMNNGTTPVSMIDATLSTRTWTLESSTTSTGPWTSIDTYTDFDATDSQDGATPWTTTRPTLQPNTYYRVKVAYNSTNADSVESVYSTFKTGDA